MENAFMASYDGISNRLICKVKIIGNGQCDEVSAQWDTGATNTFLSAGMIKRLNLVSVGKQVSHTSSGDMISDRYLVDVVLPNNVRIQNLIVCDSKIDNQGIDVLIGMDIISKGDFAVSNYNGITSFTFRIPSVGEIDFAKEAKTNIVINATNK